MEWYADGGGLSRKTQRGLVAVSFAETTGQSKKLAARERKERKDSSIAKTAREKRQTAAPPRKKGST